MSSTLALLGFEGLSTIRSIFYLGFLAVGLYVSYILATTLSNAYLTPLSKIPGPRLNALSKVPRLIQMFKGNEVVYLTHLHATYGPVVRVGPREVSFAKGAQAFREIYGFNKTGLQDAKDMRFYVRPINGVHSLVTADAANHKRMRTIVAHSFSDRSLKIQEPLLKKWASLLKDRLQDSVDSGKPAEMVKLYNCATFDIMGDLTFSEDLGMLRSGELLPWVLTVFKTFKAATKLRVIKAYSVGNYLVEKIFFGSPAIRARSIENWNFTASRLERRLQREPAHPDLTAKILEKEGMEGKSLLPGEHQSNSLAFMTAGTETTATALSGITYYLLANPEYYKKLTTEIRSAFKSFDEMTVEGLARLKYLHAVGQEGIRIYPPIPNGLPRRTPPEGATICGWEIPADTVVAAPHAATYRMPWHFAKANEFHPERWLGEGENDPAFANDDTSAFEPFSTGPRNCLGKNLAWHELRVLLATVLLHFDLKFADNNGKGPENWPDQKTYVVWEKHPLNVAVTPVAGAA